MRVSIAFPDFLWMAVENFFGGEELGPPFGFMPWCLSLTDLRSCDLLKLSRSCVMWSIEVGSVSLSTLILACVRLD